MKIFNTIEKKDYTVDELYLSAPISWELISSSNGINITAPDDLEGAVVIQRASNDEENFYSRENVKINENTGTYEYVLYRSIKHLFYNNGYFYSGSTLQTASLTLLPNDFYVVSVGQNFYGDRIKPGSFELTTDIVDKIILDDSLGNLFISESGIGKFLGNIFYDQGIAIIKQDTGSINTALSADGLKIVDGTEIYVDYTSDVKTFRHEINVKIPQTEYNFSPFNPSIFRTYQASGSVSASFFTASMSDINLKPSGSSIDTWNLYNLMGASIVKPYITTIGLYNDQYELLAVAKLATPIQRTFDMSQIFIVRFDT